MTAQRVALTLDEQVHAAVFKLPAGEKLHCQMAPRDADTDWNLIYRCTRCGKQIEKSPGGTSRGMLGRCVPPVPPYSTDIGEAWEVVNWLLEIIPNRDLHIETLGGNGWKVGSCMELGEWTDWVEAETLPEAICRAALAAVRGAADGEAGA